MASAQSVARGAASASDYATNRGTRLGVKRIRDLVRSSARAAGLTVRVTPHTLRHGCATHLLQNGADIRHVQKLLGHASVETTAIYTKVAPNRPDTGPGRGPPAREDLEETRAQAAAVRSASTMLDLAKRHGGRREGPLPHRGRRPNGQTCTSMPDTTIPNSDSSSRRIRCTR